MAIDLWRHFKKGLMVYIGIGIAVSFLSAANVFYFQKLLDSFGKTLDWPVVFIYGLTLVLVPLLSYLEQKPKTTLYNSMYFYLKEQALVKISKIAYSEYLQIGSGALLQKTEAGATAGRNIHLNFYGRLFKELLPETLFNLAFIAMIDKRLIPAILVGYLVVFIVTNLLLKVLRSLKERALVSEETMNSTFIRGLTEMVTFRINKRFEKEIAQYKNMSADTTERLTKMTMIHEFFFGFFAVLVALIKVVIVVLAFTNQITVSLGGLAALIIYVDRIYTPVAIFNVIFVQYNLDKVAFERLNEFFYLPEDKALTQGDALSEAINCITVKDLSVILQEKQILTDSTLELKRGAIYGLVGESGAGKSTLVKTILGLYQPTTGAILINNKNLAAYNLNDYYEHIFYLSQDAPIFQGTLKENIIFDKEIADEEIIAVLEKCQLGAFYQALKGGLSAEIGEKGANLSGGEKQRIAFARLFFTNAEVIVLDEATSALDETTEEKLFAAIKDQLKNKLVIMITHRPKNLIYTDEIIELKKTQVVAASS
ncbi:ABC transporter ATP-binding protein [Enterococcus casseliflavus]|uniref:ABC transporter ATP-binding protein n=1 Tax=Enterococcus casseliflavus TaxID=37734 RepID=UPI003EDFD15A